MNGLCQFSDESPHDYETLSPLYNLKPSRPAPQVPGAPVVPKKGITPGKKPPPRSAYNTLGGWNELDGIPFYLNPTLEGSFKVIYFKIKHMIIAIG